MPICCSSGRSVASEAQMQPSETSMKLQILKGTIVSAECAARFVSDVGDIMDFVIVAYRSDPPRWKSRECT